MISKPILVLLMAIAGLAMLAGTAAIMVQRDSPWPTPRPGGAFTAQDVEGRAVTQADFLGKPSAFYFGFTHCPDACPTALFTLSESLRALGPSAERLNVAFVTIDPERDTADLMKTYLEAFHERIRGLRAAPRDTERMAARFHVVARRVATGGEGYTFDHSTTVMLFDKTGRLVGGIDHDESAALATAKLRRLLAPGSCIPGAPASLWEASVVKGSVAARCD